MLTLALIILAQAPLPPNHPPTGAAPQKAPSADELIKKLDSTAGLKEKEKPFEIAASLGHLYLSQGRYKEAQEYLGQALARAEPVRSFYFAQRRAAGAKALPPPSEVGCTPATDVNMDTLFTRAKDKAKAGNAPAAAACARAALLGLMEVDVHYGNTQFINNDLPGALATYTKALETFETNADARYSRAALILDTKGDDVASLKLVKADLERFLAEVPTSPRAGQAKRLLERASAAIDAGGISKLPKAVAAATPQPEAPHPGTPPQLSPEVINAFQNAPRTAEMEQNFVKLVEEAEEHLARGRYQDALNNYRQVMPYQPDNARLRAGMAWTMVKLNRQPMATNVWNVAVQDPDAVAALGDLLKSKGDTEGARALWLRLKESVPSYAPKLDGRL